MAFNPYYAVKGVSDDKAKYETSKAGGATDFDKYHANAQNYYNELVSNGYADLADELRNSNYMQSLDILSRYSPGSGYTDQYGDLMAAVSKNMLDYGNYRNDTPAPTYNNRYDPQINELLAGVKNYGPFSYDPNTDDLYAQYKKEYTREGKRATEDAIGSAAALTGGLPSTAAVTAASQAGDYYASQLTDKIPELYQIAYNKYLNDFNQELSKLSAYQGAEQSDYAKFLDTLSQYNNDRNFDYNVWADGYNRQASNLSALMGLSENEYARYLDEQNREDAKRSNAWAEAEAKAQYGDLSGLEALGVDTSNIGADNGLSLADQISLAKLGATYGDYNKLRELGINPVEKTNEAPAGSATPAGYTADTLTSYARNLITDGNWNSYTDFIKDLYDIAGQSGISDSKVTPIITSLENYAKLMGYETLKDWIESTGGGFKYTGNTTKGASGYQNSYQAQQTPKMRTTEAIL